MLPREFLFGLAGESGEASRKPGKSRNSHSPRVSSGIHDMFRSMKAPFDIDARLFAKLKREAARQRSTLSQVTESAFRLLLGSRPESRAVPELPTFHGGGELVDIANRDAFYQAIEGR